MVEFQGHYMLNIKGNVKALGALGDTILFTVKDTTGFHNIENGTGGWNGIKIDNSDGTMGSSDSSIFRYCKFQYGKSITPGDQWSSYGGGGMFIQNFLKVLIQNCVFRTNSSASCGGALLVGSACDPAIYHCAFIKNKAVAGGAIRLTYVSKPVIYKCLFYKNTCLTNGGAIWSHFGKGKILNNTFSNNISHQSGGAIYLDNSNEEITGNLVVNNYTMGGGGGIMMTIAWPLFFNNTVCYNHAGLGGGGIEFWGLCNADFFNNILWGNTEGDGLKSANQVRINSTSSTPNFYNCIIQDGIGGIQDYNGKYRNIIENDPQFIDPPINSGIDSDGLEANWTLYETSPSINKGDNNIIDEFSIENDLRGYPRVIHGIIDIGAFETRICSITASNTITTNTTWIADTVRVTGDIIINDNVVLNISPGTRIEFQGYYGIQVIGVLHACGSEFAPITFTVNDTTGLHDRSLEKAAEGSWKGIIFDNSQYAANGIMNDNDSSVLRHCIIQYVKYYPTEWFHLIGGAVRIRYFSNLEISKCTIKYNISENGGGLSIDMHSNPFITGNLFYRNIATEKGGGMVISDFSLPMIINNYIFNNAIIDDDILTPRGGGGIAIQASNPVILNNVICNNTAAFGAGLTVGSSKPIFSNNTICNNLCAYDGSALCEWDSEFDIYNSVFWGNVSEDDFFAKKPIVISDPLNFYHNNIEGGQEAINLPNGVLPGDYSGNINDDPVFINPTEGPGIEYDALLADWSITDLSSNINKGFPDIEQLMLPVKDIAGNKRVNHEIIDIGAFENQGDPVQITQQPFGPIVCAGDSVKISVQVEGTASFQWLKNDEPITSASGTTNTLVLNSVTPKDVADYICIIRNGYGMLLSHAARLIVNSPPEILFQTESQWVREDDNIRLEIHARA